jgi:3D (Asp-Asp-Asp) domain-containing protein
MIAVSRSARRKLLATALTAGLFTLLYQATVIDSRSVISHERAGARAVDPPTDNTRATFEATAYCRGQLTAAGVPVRAGIAASDPRILPLGSVIRVDGIGTRYQGVYTVLDTGPEIKGREIDVYMWNCDEAKSFGRRQVTVTVLRRGWVQGGIRR